MAFKPTDCIGGCFPESDQLNVRGDNSRELTAFRRALLTWYVRHGRNLPWRNLADPYRVWISEVMLQQTTVAAVKPYFERFLERFPTVRALADAPEADVLRLWEGLGYYSRARNLHAAARVVVEQRGGEFPRSVAELCDLPGVGRYTAGAIASFAMGLAAPIVEANTLRLYSRLMGLRIDPRSSAGQAELWDFAEAILPGTQPGRFNQALMDLGAVVCTPKSPTCPECPVMRFCEAFQTDAVAEIPRLAPKPAMTPVTEAAVAVRDRHCYLLRQRQPGERWAGLWDFPRFNIDAVANTPGLIPSTLVNEIHSLTGHHVRLGEQITEFAHVVTRYRITLKCFSAELLDLPDGNTSQRIQAPQVWADPKEFSDYPLSVTGRKLARLLISRE